MKNIKFRAWDETLQKWYQIDRSVLAIDPHGNLYSAIGNDNVNVSQYTGLRDKNDVEIYEGDIIQKTNAQTGQKMAKSVVSYHDNSARFTGLSFGTAMNMEIIGNIYEPPKPPKEPKDE